MSPIFSVSLIFFQLVPFSAPRKILTIRIGYIVAAYLPVDMCFVQILRNVLILIQRETHIKLRRNV